MFNQLRSRQKSREVLFVFWQYMYRPEKSTRLLTLNKNTVWYGLCKMMKMHIARGFDLSKKTLFNYD
jgi:hypothetical protein